MSRSPVPNGAGDQSPVRGELISDQYKVFVGGISWHTDDKALKTTFTKYCTEPIDARVMLDRTTGRSRGFGFVSFISKTDMEECIAKLHDTDLDERRISVSRAIPQNEIAPGQSMSRRSRDLGPRPRYPERERYPERGYDRYERRPPSPRGGYYERDPYPPERYDRYSERYDPYPRDPYARDPYARRDPYYGDYPPAYAGYERGYERGGGGYPYDDRRYPDERYVMDGRREPPPDRTPVGRSAPPYERDPGTRSGGDAAYDRYPPRSGGPEREPSRYASSRGLPYERGAAPRSPRA